MLTFRLFLQISGICFQKAIVQYITFNTRPAKSPDLDPRLPAFSLLYRLSGFHVKISGKIIKFPAFFRTYFLKFTNKLTDLNVS